jgi:hypothetical protein
MSSLYQQVAQMVIDKLQLTKQRHEQQTEYETWFGLIDDEVKLLPQADFVELAMSADATLMEMSDDAKTGADVMRELVASNLSHTIDQLLHVHDGQHQH